MAEPKNTTYLCGKAAGYHYVFERAGDQIPLHTHTNPEMHHNVMVMKGAVLVEVHDLDTTRRYEVKAGDLPLDFEFATPHSVTALADGTVTFHLFTNGRPEGW